MAGKTIDATLRLATDFARARAELQAFRAEEAAAKAKAATGGRVGGASTTTAKPEADAAASTAAVRDATAEHVKQAAVRSQADRQAAAEALAAQQAALRAQREAERKAARERRTQEDEDLRAKRRVEAQRQRDDLQATAAKARAEKEERRKLTQVAPQVTDIVTSLAGGQNPLLVAIQQGGQLRDLFGGATNAARALMSVITPMRVLAVGLVGSLAGIATSIASGYFESERLRKSLALSGNAAGTSLGQISAEAKNIVQQVGVTIGTARDVVEQVLGLAGQTSNTLGETGRAAAALAKLSGSSAAEATKIFEDQAAGVTAWAIKANKAYNFLTADQVAYIRRLEQQGKTQDAIRFSNAQLADSLQGRTVIALGTLEKAWSATGRAISFFVDKIKELGRDETAEDQLKKLQQRLDDMRKRNEGVDAPNNRKPRNAFADQQVADTTAPISALRTGIVEDEREARQARVVQRKIFEQSRAFQESITAVTLAESQKRLQGQLAALEKQRAAIELTDARGLLSERDKALALNKIDQQRLAAQAAVQKEQAAAARSSIGLETDELARKGLEARAVEAEAQLISIQSQLNAAIAEAQRIVEADTLKQSRERAQQWADVWRQADEQVRQLATENAVTQADQLDDPKARAEAQAQVRVQAIQRQLNDTARDLKVQIGLAISPETRDELRQQLGALLLEGTQAMNEVARRTQQDSVGSQLATQMEALRLAEQQLSAEVERGAITSEEAERRKFEARAAALPQLREMLVLMQGLARTDAERNAVQALVLQLDQVADKTTELQRLARTSAQSGLADMFTSIVTGADSADKALGKFIANFARRMLDLLNQRLAEKLVNSAVDALNGIQKSAGQSGNSTGWVAALAQLFVGTKHTGGMIDGTVRAGKMIAPWLLDTAQVLHTGGLVGSGLKANEQLIVAEVGEEMLTADDPRHRNNLRRGSATGPLIGALNISVSTEGTGSTEGDATMARRLAGLIKSTVEQTLANEMRPGGMLQNVGRS